MLQEEIFKDQAQAQSLYERALQSSPGDCMVLNDYASFAMRALNSPSLAASLCVWRDGERPERANERETGMERKRETDAGMTIVRGGAALVCEGVSCLSCACLSVCRSVRPSVCLSFSLSFS